jgi:hypothetical protein
VKKLGTLRQTKQGADRFFTNQGSSLLIRFSILFPSVGNVNSLDVTAPRR